MKSYITSYAISSTELPNNLNKTISNKTGKNVHYFIHINNFKIIVFLVKNYRFRRCYVIHHENWSKDIRLFLAKCRYNLFDFSSLNEPLQMRLHFLLCRILEAGDDGIYWHAALLCYRFMI